MEYNTAREKMIIPEYGRNVQKMVNYCTSIEDDQERNKVANAIIKVMGQLNPHLRDITDFKHKLWDHIVIMSDFKLKIDSPYPYPDREVLAAKPKKLSYPSKKIRYKHYGQTTERLIEKAKEFEGEEKKALSLRIANLMKRNYLNWNRESVSDQLILDQLKQLSKGDIVLDPDTVLISANEVLPKGGQRPQNRKQQKGKKQNNRPKRRK